MLPLLYLSMTMLLHQVTDTESDQLCVCGQEEQQQQQKRRCVSYCAVVEGNEDGYNKPTTTVEAAAPDPLLHTDKFGTAAAEVAASDGSSVFLCVWFRAKFFALPNDGVVADIFAIYIFPVHLQTNTRGCGLEKAM